MAREGPHSVKTQRKGEKYLQLGSEGIMIMITTPVSAFSVRHSCRNRCNCIVTTIFAREWYCHHCPLWLPSGFGSTSDGPGPATRASQMESRVLGNQLQPHSVYIRSTYVLTEVKSLSHVRLFAIPWTVAYQASLSMGFSRQEYWSELPFPSPGDLPDPGIKPRSPTF